MYEKIVFIIIMFICAYLFLTVESVVFCQMSPLQLSVYRQLLGSKLIGSCLRRECDSSPHLQCISALRKVANSPGLVVSAARGVALIEEQLEGTNMDQSEVGSLMKCVCDHSEVI